MDKQIILDRIDSINRHISHVRANCEVLGEKLIKLGEEDLGVKLIANGLIHDNSKFYGIEFLYLNQETKEKDNEKFEMAVANHVSRNFHHPECWGGIENAPRVYLAEFLCDVKGRSEEFGTDIEEWLKGKATKKYKFPKNGKVYKEIMYFLNLLLDKEFK